MICITFILRETGHGWFVDGPSTMGPFCSRDRALNLAEGMVSALNACGERAELVFADPAPFRQAAAPHAAPAALVGWPARRTANG